MKRSFPVCYAISPKPVLVMNGSIAKSQIRKLKEEARAMKKRIRLIESAISRLNMAIEIEKRQKAKQRTTSRKGGEI